MTMINLQESVYAASVIAAILWDEDDLVVTVVLNTHEAREYEHEYEDIETAEGELETAILALKNA